MVLYSLGAEHRHDPPGGYSTEQVTDILAFLDYLAQALPTDYGDDLRAAHTPWELRLGTPPPLPILLHLLDKPGEEIIRIVGAGAGLRVILHRKDWQFLMAHTGDCLVIQVPIGNL